jgi:hypothetical protein
MRPHLDRGGVVGHPSKGSEPERLTLALALEA